MSKFEQVQNKAIRTWKNLRQWMGKSLFTKQTAEVVASLIDALQGLIVWILEVFCVLGSIVLVWHAITSLLNAELITGMVLAFAAAWLLVVCMISDRYRHGQPQTGGGVNPSGRKPS